MLKPKRISDTEVGIQAITFRLYASRPFQCHVVTCRSSPCQCTGKRSAHKVPSYVTDDGPSPSQAAGEIGTSMARRACLSSPSIDA